MLLEAVAGLSGQALVRLLGDEGCADFVNWRWLAQFRVLLLGNGLRIDEAEIPGEVTTYISTSRYQEMHNYSRRAICHLINPAYTGRRLTLESFSS